MDNNNYREMFEAIFANKPKRHYRYKDTYENSTTDIQWEFFLCMMGLGYTLMDDRILRERIAKTLMDLGWGLTGRQSFHAADAVLQLFVALGQKEADNG